VKISSAVVVDSVLSVDIMIVVVAVGCESRTMVYVPLEPPSVADVEVAERVTPAVSLSTAVDV